MIFLFVNVVVVVVRIEQNVCVCVWGKCFGKFISSIYTMCDVCALNFCFLIAFNRKKNEGKIEEKTWK